MSDLIHYIAVYGRKTIGEVPLSAVDGLIFTAMSYIHFDGLIPEKRDNAPTVRETVKALLLLPERERLKKVHSLHNQELLRAMAESKRFSNLRLTGYRNIKSADLELQFSAITVLLGGENAFVAYRGTDGTLVGWKEDFNLSFLDTIPGQWIACNYLTNLASRIKGSLWVGGHSKGGNLAVFAAACAARSIKARIPAVYNYDGPGFSRTVLDSAGYQSVLSLVRTYVPQSSVVGMLLGHEEPYTVIRSSEKGLMQHDLYSWEIRKGDFVVLKDITEGSCLVEHTIKHWIYGLTPREREAFVDTLYEIFLSSGATRTGELLLPGNILEIAENLLIETDEEKRENILNPLLLLVKAAGQTLAEFCLKEEEK